MAVKTDLNLCLLSPYSGNNAAPRDETTQAIINMPTSHSAVVINQRIHSWCVAELFPWITRGVPKSIMLREFERLNNINPFVFIFHIANGEVTTWEKPTRLTDERAEKRRQVYVEFTRQIICESRLTCDLGFAFALDVSDLANFGDMSDDIVPIFRFQKKAGTKWVLFPDLDFCINVFYNNTTVQDNLPFMDKAASAIFVGSTTGQLNTVKSVIDPRSDRLRAAIYFRNHPHVHFHLPNIVQCASPEVADLLKAMSFGGGERIPWLSQFEHKFLISVDGNGATCSRVVIGLKSHSALIKYDSVHVLYYFAGLRPWLHYVPITRARDVEAIVRIEREAPGTFEYVARAGRTFAEAYLTEQRVKQYAAGLIRYYNEWIFNRERPAAPGLALRDEHGVPSHSDNIIHARPAMTNTWEGNLSVPSDDANPTLDHLPPLPGIPYFDFLRNVSLQLEPKTYFEIGTAGGRSAACFNCDTICVDPNFQFDNNPIGLRRRMFFFQMPSDEFFGLYDLSTLFPDGIDVAFLDGLHLFEALLKDFINTERFCRSGSLVLIHDCLPRNLRMAERSFRLDKDENPSTRGAWTGDVWRLLPILKDYRPDLRVAVLDCPPTGLVAVSNLNRRSTVLTDRYEEIVNRYSCIELSSFGIRRLEHVFPLLNTRPLLPMDIAETLM
jgi:hypothetical protein